MIDHSGIYKITNTVTGCFYIGSAVDIGARWRTHRSLLANKYHVNRHLQYSWNKHGENCFEFSVLELCEVEKLIEREQFYMDLLKPEYNILPTAGSTLGFKFTDETKRKMSEAQKARPPKSDETKRKLSEVNRGENNHSFGKPHSEEHRAKISKALKGRVVSDETRSKLSAATTRYYEARREAMLTAKIPNALELNRQEARVMQTGLF